MTKLRLGEGKGRVEGGSRHRDDVLKTASPLSLDVVKEKYNPGLWVI